MASALKLKDVTSDSYKTYIKALLTVSVSPAAIKILTIF